MPLTPLLVNVRVSSPHYVRFPMEDRGRQITVHIAANWLRQLGSADGLITAHLSLLWSHYRERIEAAASIKYDQFYCDGADVVVVASDIQ